MNEEHQDLHFPAGFLWGASTSSHQVEGGNSNDWSEWEKSEKRLEELKKSGQLDKHGLDNFISHNAARHFHLYKDDYKLAQDMGHNATRLSLEWSRIEPEEGIFDEEALHHYHSMIQHIRSLGIEPFVTLWHWSLPLWLRDQGGWMNKKCVQYFNRFVLHVVDHLKDDVKFWVTLNEPEIFTANSYYAGIWPPQEKSVASYWKVLHNLISGHKAAFDTIKKIQPSAQIGIAKNNMYFEPHGNLVHNRLAKKLYNWWWNFYFLNHIKNHQDFIGLNYYFRNRIVNGVLRSENKISSDLGWDLYPEGIYHVLTDLKKYQKPIYITENGLADATDKSRSWFIVQILQFVHQAITDGADVRGYLHWSLIDNFEWHEGFHARFGLVEVDYKTQTRKPRASALLYGEIIKNNKIHKELLEKHMRHPEE